MTLIDHSLTTGRSLIQHPHEYNIHMVLTMFVIAPEPVSVWSEPSGEGAPRPYPVDSRVRGNDGVACCGATHLLN